MHKLRVVAASVEHELNNTSHVLSRFGSFEVRPINLMQVRGWGFAIRMEKRPKISSKKIAFVRRLLARHLQDHGIEVHAEQDSFSRQPGFAALGPSSVIDYSPTSSFERPYAWSWTLNLKKEPGEP